MASQAEDSYRSGNPEEGFDPGSCKPQSVRRSPSPDSTNCLLPTLCFGWFPLAWLLPSLQTTIMPLQPRTSGCPPPFLLCSSCILCFHPKLPSQLLMLPHFLSQLLPLEPGVRLKSQATSQSPTITNVGLNSYLRLIAAFCTVATTPPGHFCLSLSLWDPWLQKQWPLGCLLVV